MDMQICNKGFCCSTLIIGDFGEYRTVKEFISAFEAAAKHSYSKGYLDECTWDDYAFVVASTDQFQNSVEDCLRYLGFSETERTEKLKNSDYDCIFWVIPVPDLIYNISLYKKTTKELYKKEKK